MKAVIFSRTRSTPSLGLMAIRGREIRFQVRFRGSSSDPHTFTQTHAHCGKRLRSKLQNNPFPRSPSSAPHPAGTAPPHLRGAVGADPSTHRYMHSPACVHLLHAFLPSSPAPRAQRGPRRRA